MKLLEAYLSAREGNFVSHFLFDEKQSMHEYKGNLYYEDGANLTGNGNSIYLDEESWAKDGRYIKYPKDRINTEKLKNLHEKHKGRMLPNDKSYEECVINIS